MEQRRAQRRKFHYIYKITREDGAYYIGLHSTDNLEDGYFGSGKRLWHSIHKHGKDKHIKEILEFLPDREALLAREKDLVCKELLEDVMCLNLALGGEGSWSCLKPEHYAAGGRVAGKKNFHNLFTEEAKQKRKRTIFERYGNTGFGIGCKHSEVTKQQMSESGTGENNSQFGTCWITNGIEVLKIKKDKLDEYLGLGFSRGRRIEK